jgi:iron complex outermembrane recepter protein
MKKKCNWVCFPPGNVSKILLRMKLLTFFVLISVISFAGSSYSQQTKFKLKLTGATVRDVFQEIEDKSEFILLYNEKQLDADRKVDVSVDNETVGSILDQVFAGTLNSYKIYDRQIVILSPDMNSIPSIIKSEVGIQQKKELIGTVKDSKELPLPGVSVVVKGTSYRNNNRSGRKIQHVSTK